MPDFGVTAQGFAVKGLDQILSESMDRARLAFDPNIDLTTTSPLRKILEVTAAEDAELWKRMEDLYYGNFVSTAIGDDLNLLGEELGVPRQQLFATGQVRFTLAGAAAGRAYLIPAGAIVITAVPVRAFFTIESLTLDTNHLQDVVGVEAFERGVASNVTAGTIQAIEPGFAQAFLDLGAATVTVTNPADLSGGEQPELEDVYRARLLGYPRNLWTVQSIQQAAAGAEGVIDVLVSDPLGGVDVSQSTFNMFQFSQRVFSSERRLGDPYFFDVVVAHAPQWPWRTLGPVQGIFEQVSAAIDPVRPVGIFPNVVEADHIDVGVAATVLVRAGFDASGVVAAVKAAISGNIGALRLGGDVLYSQVMRAFVEQPGVLDVQNMHLRRCPPAFARFSFGNVPFQTGVVEAAIGENLHMGPTEIAIFRVDSPLSSIVVKTR